MIRRVDNPPNPFQSECLEYLEELPRAEVEVYEEQARSILSENHSPDLPFRWSANPYRGCQHACAYCYARPYHEYLELGAGTDFDTKLFVKVNAPELLRKALRSRKWDGSAINFSGVTDCYQPLEAVYKTTRKMLEVCLELANPVGIVTKSYLIARDAELLADLHRTIGANVFFSIPFADADMARLIEPHAPPPQRRFDAMERLAQAGVPVHVMVAPIIPGLNESDIPTILERAAACGARYATHTALRLPGNVETVFFSRLQKALPLRARKIESRLREIRGGKTTHSGFGDRMRGHGAYWDSIARLFDVQRQRHGLSRPRHDLPMEMPTPRKRLSETVQLRLPFEDTAL
jgi:DNA repair photolyase